MYKYKIPYFVGIILFLQIVVSCSSAQIESPHQDQEVKTLATFILNNDFPELQSEDPQMIENMVQKNLYNPELWSKTKSHLATLGNDMNDEQRQKLNLNISILEMSIEEAKRRRTEELIAESDTNDENIAILSLKPLNSDSAFANLPKDQKIADLQHEIQFGLDKKILINTETAEIIIYLLIAQNINKLYGIIIDDIRLYTNNFKKVTLIEKLGGRPSRRNYFRKILQGDKVYKIPLVFKFPQSKIPINDINLTFTFENKNYSFKRSLGSYLKRYQEDEKS